MCRMQMLENIVAHSIQVCRVGMCLVNHLKLQGNQLNGQLVQTAALLHDITKTRSFETEENQALTGGQVLTDFGYLKVGDRRGRCGPPTGSIAGRRPYRYFETMDWIRSD